MLTACINKGGRAFFVLSLFITACNTSTKQSWKEETVYCSIRSNHSSRLALAPENPAREMGLEFVSGKGKENLFLTSYCLEFPESISEPGFTTVEAFFAGSECTFMAKRMKGGQKLLVPQEKARFFIKLLFENCPVTFRTGFLEATIDPISFKTSYQHLISRGL